MQSESVMSLFARTAETGYTPSLNALPNKGISRLTRQRAKLFELGVVVGELSEPTGDVSSTLCQSCYGTSYWPMEPVEFHRRV